jgi:hypothetical protein|tara:strand:- start:5005 stop:5754 length:750 start_codon:yes stop_codon:yes gene_type:complete
MSEELDLSNIPDNYPSLCIPRVFSNVKRDKIFQTIKDLRIGFIDRIDMISRTTTRGDTYQRVYIHFKKWFPQSMEIRKRFIDGEEIKIIYDEPWFWKVFINKYVHPNTTNNYRSSENIKSSLSEEKYNDKMKTNNSSYHIKENENQKENNVSEIIHQSTFHNTNQTYCDILKNQDKEDISNNQEIDTEIENMFLSTSTTTYADNDAFVKNHVFHCDNTRCFSPLLPPAPRDILSHNIDFSIPSQKISDH